MEQLIITATGKSRRGLVAATAGCLAGLECNILDSSQFVDEETDRFFVRMVVRSEGRANVEMVTQALSEVGRAAGLDLNVYSTRGKMRAIILVSRFGHCLNDLLYRSRIGALPIEVVGVISNHKDHSDTVRDYDVPFFHVPVTPASKVEAEARQLEIIRQADADLVVLARYMQVLSNDLCEMMSGRIINIHHSFLPSFKGAVPYRRAFEKGVKLIGATAHYVTGDLDEGPIIEQDIARVSHAQNAQDFVALGRDVEAQVLARAVHAHADRRVLLNGLKTVVFPASPGAFSDTWRAPADPGAH